MPETEKYTSLNSAAGKLQNQYTEIIKNTGGIMRQKIQRYLVGGVMILNFLNLYGCAGGQIHTERFKGKHRLYADLEKAGDSDFKLTRLSTDASLPIVVNNLSTTLDTKEYDCGTYHFNVPAPNNKSGCPKENLFRRTTVDKGITAAGTIITLGTSTLVGMNTRSSNFDFDLYNIAVRSALKEPDRLRYIDKFDEFMEQNWKLEDKHSQNIKTLNSGFRELYDKYDITYSASLKNTNIQLTVSDQSGFYDGSITPSMLLSLDKNDVQVPFLSFYPMKTSFTSTAADFEQTMADILRSNQEPVDLESANINERHREYEELLKEKTSYLLISDKNVGNLNDFNISVSAPKSVKINQTGSTVVNAFLNVLSKNFSNVRPKFSIQDKNLHFKFDGKKVTLKNMTAHYVQIRSISIYYNNDVSTILCEIEIAPESYTENLLYEPNMLFSSLKAVRDYPDMTVAKAKKQNISYGYAIKYRVVETNLDNTLYKKSQLNLFDVLAGR